MRVAIVSDIHGNRPAFEAVLADIREAELDAIWCLGDLVGYGAEPDACVQLAREHADLCLVGNHDLAVRGDLPLTEFSRGAALAAVWTKEVASRESIAVLGAGGQLAQRRPALQRTSAKAGHEHVPRRATA